jgi:hypothetical protein
VVVATGDLNLQTKLGAVGLPSCAIVRLWRSARGSGRRGIAVRWTGEDYGHVLEQLQPAVECTAGDHFEGDVGIRVVDPFPPGAAGDDGEDDHPEAVNKTSLEQRPAQGEAANRA